MLFRSHYVITFKSCQLLKFPSVLLSDFPVDAVPFPKCAQIFFVPNQHHFLKTSRHPIFKARYLFSVTDTASQNRLLVFPVIFRAFFFSSEHLSIPRFPDASLIIAITRLLQSPVLLLYLRRKLCRILF